MFFSSPNNGPPAVLDDKVPKIIYVLCALWWIFMISSAGIIGYTAFKLIAAFLVQK